MHSWTLRIKKRNSWLMYKVCVRGTVAMRKGLRKAMTKSKHDEGMSTFSVLLQVKPAGTWDSSAACDWLMMWWNDGVRILKELLWLVDAGAHTWWICTHANTHTNSCMYVCQKKKNTFGWTHLNSLHKKSQNMPRHMCTQAEKLNLELHACTHASTQCQSCLKRRDWNQKETGEKQGGCRLNESLWHGLVY